jgi:L-asparagine transporter-like permease
LEIFHIKFVGLSAENLHKLLATLVLVGAVVVLRLILNAVVHPTSHGDDDKSAATRFWVQQGVGLAAAVLFVFGLISIWFDNTDRLTTILGFVALVLATINVVGGFLVTHRMLGMFRKRD